MNALKPRPLSNFLRFARSYATAASEAPKAVDFARWNPNSQRTGLLVKKLGMTAVWDAAGNKIPVTVLHVEPNVVLSTISKSGPSPSATLVRRSPHLARRKEYHAVQIAAGPIRKRKNVKPGVRGQYDKEGLEPRMKVAQFQVTKDALLEIGTELSASHFVPGQYVDCQAITIGKGFQGGMKRWGFHGQSASHGTSLAHRSLGATGQHQDPGRVFPGKKMPGRMGGKNATMSNLYVVRLDIAKQIIYVKGSVPGAPNNYVRLTDAKKRTRSIARKRVKEGTDVNPATGEKEVIEGVITLPFPAGTLQMDKALGLPPEIMALPKPKPVST
ncbi:ribosomal large subunit assembly and maintenance-related protein [Atractiella rhizophila]|nr:ribosomal large subunit assembly and maintenance-related protein [Atractiella rhizophila]